MFLHFPPSHYFHILSIICLTSDINWHSPRWFWGFIEKRLGGLLSRRKSWPTWLSKAIAKEFWVPQQHAVLALYSRSLPMTSYFWLLHPDVKFLGERIWVFRGLHPELVSSGQEQGFGAHVSSGIKDRFIERRVTVSGQPSLGVSAIIVHIGFPRKEMRNSPQLKDLHTRAHTHTKENVWSLCFG